MAAALERHRDDHPSLCILQRLSAMIKRLEMRGRNTFDPQRGMS
jgi:hypothetical protein